MNSVATSTPSKPTKRRIVLGIVAVLGLIAMLVLIELWVITRNGTNIFHFSKNAQHFETHVGGGRLFVFHISNWWTDTPPQVSGANEPPPLDLRNWIGFDVESESRIAGCSHVTGIFHPPLIDMTNVVITPHFQRGESFRFRAWIFPIWIPCVVCALPCVLWMTARRRRTTSDAKVAPVETGTDEVSKGDHGSA